MKLILAILLITSVASAGNFYHKGKVFIPTPIAKPKPVDLTKFYKWRNGLKQRMAAQGINAKTLKYLDNITPNKQVIRLDKKQPEGTITFKQYNKRILSKQRIAKGRQMFKKHRKLLQDVSDVLNVEPQYIVALWGIETNYGSYTGSNDVLQSLVSLAYDGRRQQMFEDQLVLALQMLQNGDVKREQLKGSWAGAMGHCQFMPSSFVKYATDYNQDGKADIWNTHGDIFASIANYLSTMGWVKGQGMAVKVQVPPKYGRTLQAAGNKRLRKQPQSIAYWRKKGVVINTPINVNEAAIILPQEDDPTLGYLLFSNYDIIMDWNRSIYFATTVSELADAIVRD